MPRLDKGTLELSHSAAEISCAAKAAIPRECVPRLNEGTLEVSHLELRSVAPLRLLFPEGVCLG